MRRDGRTGWRSGARPGGVLVGWLVVVAACGADTVRGRPVANESSAGGGGGEGGVGGAAAGCPNVPPADGHGCASEGLSCSWSSGDCTREAICAEGMWQVESSLGCSCASEDECDCPATVPSEGGKCVAPDLTCSYDPLEGCGFGFVATCNGDRWVVESLQPGCELTCPAWPDPAFLSSPCDPCCHHRCSGGASCSYYWAYCVDGAWTMESTPC